MPRGDRTGPAGFGSMTGRAAGYCAGYAMSGFTNVGALGRGGRALGRGGGPGGRGLRFWGRGRGRGLRWSHAPYGYHPYYGYPPY